MASFGTRRARDTARVFRHVAMMVHGDSGSGKSRAGALTPRPVILVFERQAMNTILQWNPDAIVVPVYEDDAEGTYTGHPFSTIESARTRMIMVEHVLQAIRAGKPVEGGGRTLPGYTVEKKTGKISGFAHGENDPVIETLVLDSLTEWQRVQLESLLGRHVGEIDDQDISLRTWGKLGEKTLGLCRRIRDLPCHTMVLGLSEDKEGRDGLKAQVALFGRKVGGQVAQFFNAVGWLVKKSEGELVRFATVFEGATATAVTKGCTGLGAIEQLPADPSEGSPALWFQRILDAQPGVALGKSPEPQAGAVDETKTGGAADYESKPITHNEIGGKRRSSSKGSGAGKDNGKGSEGKAAEPKGRRGRAARTSKSAK